MDRVARRGRIPGRRFVVLDVGAALMSEGRALGDESVDSLRPQDFELMDGIAAAIARRPTSFAGSAPSASSAPDVAIVPPEGTW